MKRLPTIEEIEELINNTTSKWTEVNYVIGRQITSEANGNSIFLPALGGYDHGNLTSVGKGGYYWTSTPHMDDRAYCLVINTAVSCWNRYNRSYIGFAVRLVSDTLEPGFVDLGLSVYWSDHNEGATKPEEYGNYYTFNEALELFSNKNENSMIDCKSLFYIKGNGRRGEEVIKFLESKGGINSGGLLGEDDSGLYYIHRPDNIIRMAYKGNVIGEFIYDMFEEVTLPEPEWKPKRGDQVLVRSFTKDRWNESIFSYCNDDSEYKYVCLGGMSWRYCIPFDINKLGTV